MTKYKWIAYLHTPMPGDIGVTQRVTSLSGALCELVDFELASGFSEGCTAMLYPYSEESWAEAEEYATIGCPFDYPSKVIERGPRGGMKVLDA